MPKTECVCICHTKYVSPCSACLGHEPSFECNGLCVMASEVLPGGRGVAIAHPGCERHGGKAVDSLLSNSDYDDVDLDPELPALLAEARKAGPAPAVAPNPLLDALADAVDRARSERGQS